MLKHIRPLIPPHNLYCEPFCGGAAVFFDKLPVEVNVINDLNGELINFYRIIVSDLKGFRKEVIQTLHSRQQHAHAWYVYNNPDCFTQTRRAWAVWMLSKTGFAGRFGCSFGFNKTESRLPKRIARVKAALLGNELKELLEKTTIECDDAFSVIKRYDTLETFHFIDPPYVNSNMGHYSGMFNDENLKDLLELCSTIKGKFMLTMYPSDVIRGYVERCGWTIHAIQRNVTACKAEYRRVQEEWMVCNYVVIL